ncbi:MAG: hypothetical protein LBC69_02450, partial [Eubacteriaceae bacterium]|nr:hypothetical protein [Eubacteriaceae bacterium]
IRTLESELEATQQQKGEVSELREKVRLSQSLARYKKYLALQAESESLEAALASQAEITDSVANFYEKATIQLEVLEKQQQSIEIQKREAEETIASYERQLGSANESIRNFPMEEMLEDKAILDNSLKKIETLTAEKQANEDTTIENRYEAIRRQQKIFSSMGTIASILAVFAIILSFPLERPAFLYGGIAVGVAGVALLALWALTNRRRNQIEDEFEKYDTVMSRTMNMLLMCELDIEHYRTKYNAKNVKELTEMLGGSQNVNTKLNELETQISVSSAALADICERLAATETEKAELKQQISQIIREAGTENEESFRFAILSIKDKAVAKARLSSSRETMETVLSGTQLSQLKIDAEKAMEMGLEPRMDGSISMEGAIEQSSEEILRFTTAIATLKATIAESESSVRGLNEIMEEIIKLKTRISEYEADLKSFILAIEKIELLSTDIHHTFADAFNDYVSNMISEITKGKYTRVRVNDKMQIKVEDQELGQLIDISSLSGGTIDQLYFCVRFAIMDLIIKDKTIPVFLDDCMLQYDDSRLSNILNLLYEKSRDRQIIIFSCRKAEKLALDEKNYYYNFVNLSKPSPAVRQQESGGLLSRS